MSIKDISKWPESYKKKFRQRFKTIPKVENNKNNKGCSNCYFCYTNSVIQRICGNCFKYNNWKYQKED